ncbi:MAG: outer membrane beta-barrel protein [Shewanellaceae bacterium]|nr:outer membrane beta-barrel protein [Shewanellaceae bacterium]
MSVFAQSNINVGYEYQDLGTEAVKADTVNNITEVKEVVANSHNVVLSYDYDLQLGNGFSVAPGAKFATSTAAMADVTGWVESSNHNVLAYKAEATVRAQYTYNKAYAFVTPGYEIEALTGTNAKAEYSDSVHGFALDMGLGYQATKNLSVELNAGTSWLFDKEDAKTSEKMDNWRFGGALRYSF